MKSKISYQVNLDDTKHRFLHLGTSPHVKYFYSVDFQQLNTLSYHPHPSLLLQKLPPTRPRQRPNSNLNRGIHLLYTCNPSLFIFKVYIYSSVVDCYFYSYETLIEFAKPLFYLKNKHLSEMLHFSCHAILYRLPMIGFLHTSSIILCVISRF